MALFEKSVIQNLITTLDQEDSKPKFVVRHPQELPDRFKTDLAALLGEVNRVLNVMWRNVEQDPFYCGKKFKLVECDGIFQVFYKCDIVDLIRDLTHCNLSLYVECEVLRPRFLEDRHLFTDILTPDKFLNGVANQVSKLLYFINNHLEAWANSNLIFTDKREEYMFDSLGTMKKILKDPDSMTGRARQRMDTSLNVSLADMYVVFDRFSASNFNPYQFFNKQDPRLPQENIDKLVQLLQEMGRVFEQKLRVNDITRYNRWLLLSLEKVYFYLVTVPNKRISYLHDVYLANFALVNNLLTKYQKSTTNVTAVLKDLTPLNPSEASLQVMTKLNMLEESHFRKYQFPTKPDSGFWTACREIDRHFLRKLYINPTEPISYKVFLDFLADQNDVTREIIIDHIVNFEYILVQVVGG